MHNDYMDTYAIAITDNMENNIIILDNQIHIHKGIIWTGIQKILVRMTTLAFQVTLKGVYLTQDNYVHQSVLGFGKRTEMDYYM